MATLVTDVGLGVTTNRLKNGATGATEPNFLHWGTGTTEVAATDTVLQSPAAEARVAGTSSIQTTNSANDTYRVVGTIVASANRAITEAGLFDASVAGNLFSRAVFAVVNVLTGESIQFTFNTVYNQG